MYKKNVLWHKNVYDFDLDSSFHAKIVEDFIKKVDNPTKMLPVERDLSSDPFYFSYQSISPGDLESISYDDIIKKNMACLELRKTGLDLIKYTNKMTKEFYRSIDIYSSMEEGDEKKALRSVILGKKRVLGLILEVRSLISEIVGYGEECYEYISEAERVVIDG